MTGEHQCFAFDIPNDVFWGTETKPWLPAQDRHVHLIGKWECVGHWSGDIIEILKYCRMLDLQMPIVDLTGDGCGVQIIYTLANSLEGVVGVPEMLPHGPNRTEENWENSKRWIDRGRH